MPKKTTKKKENNQVESLVPDTSVIIEGLVSKRIERGELDVKTIIIHEAVVAELEHQANLNKSSGHLGLDELGRIKNLASEKGIELVFAGKKPSMQEIQYASLGEIDSIIRDLAWEKSATLFTADRVQGRVAEAKSMSLIFVDIEKLHKKLKMEEFFDDTTMSVHLRENVEPFAKKGVPGAWEFVAVRKKKLTRKEVEEISREIIEEATTRKDSFIEIERPGSTIIQLGNYRIVITKPPFSDGWEITSVRPVRRLGLDDYKMSEKLLERIQNHAEGILIAGSPGMGKSTFAQAMAEFYCKDKIVKTVEAPRDLVLPENITQYAISHGDAQEIHDVLLLSRPDYAIFDEMRNTDDFKLFADLRLAGIGLLGVVHATMPIDAIHRFMGRLELGVIPQVIDTVIFIKNGAVDKVLNLTMTVKVPSGMTEADLARPVVTVNDFETKKLEFEIYTYGEQTVVIPVKEASQKSSAHKMAEGVIQEEFLNYTDDPVVDVSSDNSCTVFVPKSDIARIIGKSGENIDRIEKKLGIHIDIQELRKEHKKERGKTTEYDTQITKKNIVFTLGSRNSNKDVDIFIDDDYLLSAKAGKSGIIKLSKKNKIGKMLGDAISAGDNVTLEIKS